LSIAARQAARPGKPLTRAAAIAWSRRRPSAACGTSTERRWRSGPRRPTATTAAPTARLARPPPRRREGDRRPEVAGPCRPGLQASSEDRPPGSYPGFPHELSTDPLFGCGSLLRGRRARLAHARCSAGSTAGGGPVSSKPLVFDAGGRVHVPGAGCPVGDWVHRDFAGGRRQPHYRRPCAGARRGPSGPWTTMTAHAVVGSGSLSASSSSSSATGVIAEASSTSAALRLPCLDRGTSRRVLSSARILFRRCSEGSATAVDCAV
jgi:hypothetical protein